MSEKLTLYLGGLAHFLVVLDEVGVVSHHPRVGITAQWQLVALHQLYTHAPGERKASKLFEGKRWW